MTAWPFDRPDCLLAVGFSSFIYGIAQWSVPAAWCVAGAMMLVFWAAPLTIVRKKKG